MAIARSPNLRLSLARKISEDAGFPERPWLLMTTTCWSSVRGQRGERTLPGIRFGQGGPMPADSLVPVELIERRIYLIRGQKVMLVTHLAGLYQVQTFRLNEQVKRNRNRFPPNFMFQLTKEEAKSLTSQFARSNQGSGGRRTPPYPITKQHGPDAFSKRMYPSTAKSTGASSLPSPS
jgi:ORF6N domain-containing protein